MTSRILPRAEYGRLAGTYLEPIAAVIPDEARVVVVEDGDRIVASWLAFKQVHLEGCSIDPDYRGNVLVVRALLGQMAKAVQELGAVRVYTGSESDEVAGLLHRLGATLLPYEHYTLEADRLRRWGPRPQTEDVCR